MFANEIMTVDEVAQYLRVHPMTVQRWCRTGEIPAAKIGRGYRIKRADLDQWWAEHQRGAAKLQAESRDVNSEGE